MSYFVLPSLPCTDVGKRELFVLLSITRYFVASV